MNLLLINPWIHDFAAYDFWAKPLGFLYLASFLRTNGFAVSFIDCLNAEHSTLPCVSGVGKPSRKSTGQGKFHKQRIDKPAVLDSVPRHYSRYGITPEAFLAQLERVPEPAAILVTSAMTYWYRGVIETIEMVKSVYPHVPLILGGIYATLCSDHARRCSGADRVIAGPGEPHVLDFLPNPANGAIPQSSDILTYPAFDLVDPLPYICIATSRGCPYRCRYCASKILSPSYTARDPIAVVDEIEYWHNRSGVTNVAFYDDALIYKPSEHIVPIMQKIVERQIICSFHTPNGIHITGMTEEIAHLMIEAGFKTIRLGLETASEERMARTGEKTTRQEFIETVGYLRDAGYERDAVGVYLLAGLPGQPAQEVEDSIGFVKDAGARPYLAEYSPIPGTSLWEEAVKASPFDLTGEPLFHNNSLFPCEWEGFTRENLDQLKKLCKS